MASLTRPMTKAYTPPPASSRPLFTLPAAKSAPSSPAPTAAATRSLFAGAPAPAGGGIVAIAARQAPAPKGNVTLPVLVHAAPLAAAQIMLKQLSTLSAPRAQTFVPTPPGPVDATGFTGYPLSGPVAAPLTAAQMAVEAISPFRAFRGSASSGAAAASVPAPSSPAQHDALDQGYPTWSPPVNAATSPPPNPGSNDWPADPTAPQIVVAPPATIFGLPPAAVYVGGGLLALFLLTRRPRA